MPPGKQKVVDGPLNELEALRREKGRLASAKYYASHPEMREKKRVKMAEKRAAVKAKRRISDRPRKPKESTALHLSLPDSTGPLEIIPPWSITSTDQSSATASTSRSERQPSSSSSSSSCDSAPAAPTVSQIPLCPIIETSAASGPSRRPRNNTESRLPPTLSIAPPRRQKVVSGPLDEREALRREKSRVASARYYAAHPEIREKKRVQMAEKRAAVKAKRRVSDRPRKPKESNHPAASLPDSTEPLRTLETFVAEHSSTSTQSTNVSGSEHQSSSSSSDPAAAPKETQTLFESILPCPIEAPPDTRKLRNTRNKQPRPSTPVPDASSGASEAESDSEEEEFDPKDGEFDPMGYLTGPAVKAKHRKASAKYYARHRPEVQEKKRIHMAEKRAAIKARRRRWDPPKKVKIAVQIEAEDVVLLAATRADDAVGMLGPSDAPPIPLMEICTENAPMASSGLPTKRTPRRVLEVSPPEPRARKNAARSKTQPVFKSPPEPTRRSPRKLASSSRILPAESPDRHEDVSVAPAPEPASPEESGETVQDQILDDVDGPGGPESATIDQNAAAKNRRKAFMKAYSQRPEVREKQRVRMAEKRAAVKARRRRWDPPKKPKVDVQDAHHSESGGDVVSSIPEEASDDNTVLLDGGESEHLEAFGFGSMGGVYSWDEVIPADEEPRAQKNPAQPFESLAESIRQITRKPASSSGVHSAEPSDRGETNLSMLPAPEPSSPLAQRQESVTRPLIHNQHRTSDEVDGQGSSSTIDRDAAAKSRRKAAMKAYSQRPEVREKQRVRMADKRAAVKARRRRWDPPKKPKADVQDAHHSESGGDAVFSMPEEPLDDDTVLVQGGGFEQLGAIGFSSMGGVYSWDV